MSTFFQQTAQAMIARHIDRFPLLKLDQVIDWQPIEQYLNRQRTRYLRDHRGRPAYPLLSMFKAVCSDNGTASPIPNSNTASSPASISTCFAVLTN
ncbi:putative transposase [Neisseria meningitidis 97027]|nr:putative transposase [Neisseria meningitidis 97027]